MTQPTISPDGHWRWDGHNWVPNQPAASAQGYSSAPGYGAVPGYAGQPGYPPYPLPSANATDGKAIASLVCAVVHGCGLGSIAAVVLGHMSRKEARQQGRQPSGLALAGIILGYVGIAGMLLVLALFVVGIGTSVHMGHLHTTCVINNGPPHPC